MSGWYSNTHTHTMTHTMTLSQQIKGLLDISLPYNRYLADGGSWATAMEMIESLEYDQKRLDYEQNLIPKWTSQLKASLKKKSPSADKHRQRLIGDLEWAYAFCGRPDAEFKAILATLISP